MITNHILSIFFLPSIIPKVKQVRMLALNRNGMALALNTKNLNTCQIYSEEHVERSNQLCDGRGKNTLIFISI